MNNSSIAHNAFQRFSRPTKGITVVSVLSILLLLVVVLAYVSFLGYFSFIPTPTLLKVAIGLFAIIIVLIARRLFSVFLVHKKGMIATGLHMKLVILFTFVSLVPAAFMAFFSLFFFHYGVESWFSEQIKTSVVESNNIAESYLEEHQNTIRADILAMASDLDRQYGVFADNRDALTKMVNTQAFYRNLSEVVIFDKNKNIYVHSGVSAIDVKTVSPFSLDAASRGDVVVLSQPDDDRVQALVKLTQFGSQFLLVQRPVDATVLSRVQQTRAASEQYLSLEDQSANLRGFLVLVYIGLTLFLVVVSIWFALLIAKSFIQPIESLVDASNRVRAGDLDVVLADETGVAELSQLNQAYNRMTLRLSKQRKELVSANRQLDERRIFTEAVLGGVSSGVISIDKDGVIKLYNAAAYKVLSAILKNEKDDFNGESLDEIFPEIKGVLTTVLSSDAQPQQVKQLEVPYVDSDGAKRDLLLRAVPEMLGDNIIGAIITFDDITQLKSAQRSAAWSDVARRIAHEIKNPLTPIQLSADRLNKKFLSYIPDQDKKIFETCIETISRHVQDIGSMVTEFSSFARMPEPKMKPVDLVSLVRQVCVLHNEGHDDVTIDLMGMLATDTEVVLNIDEQMIRQAFMNVLQNAIDAVKDRDSQYSGVDIWGILRQDKIYLISRDTGAGFTQGNDKSKLLEPYITHKKHGTGLGLSIVKKIMNDHNGEIFLGEMAWMKDIEGWEERTKKGVDGAIVSLIFPATYNNNNQNNE